jgi:transposase
MVIGLDKELHMAEKGKLDHTEKEHSPPGEFAAFVGIDWADKKHDVCLMVHGSNQREHHVIDHTPEALNTWVAELRTRFEDQPIAVCLEQSRGPLIYNLMKHDLFVLYPINPRTLAKYREALSPSGAKDDPTDADLLLDLILLHRDRFTPWVPDDEQTRKIALLTEGRNKAIQLRTKLSNALTSALKAYFPQALHLLGDKLYTTLACDFLKKWPTLQDAKRAKPETIRAFYYGHNCRRGDRIEERIRIIQNATPLTTDRAVIDASVMMVKMLSAQLRALIRPIKEYERQIRVLFESHPDAPLFAGLPGSGPVLAPRLLAAFGTDRTRFPAAEDIQKYSGIAPVTQRSGDTFWVHWRWACPKFIRQSFHEFGNQSIRYCPWARAYYQQQREKGKSHHAAIRALAFKWIRIIHRCWRDRRLYDEATYLQALKRTGSSLLPHHQKPKEKLCA